MIIKYLSMAIAFIIAIVGHEIMHGLVAKYYSDLTATYEGRLSINPIKHIDPFGSIVFPLILFASQKLAGVENPLIFGWAKPVPINVFTVVKNGGYIGVFNVSIAGVTYNLFLAIIASSLIGFFINPDSVIDVIMFMFLAYLIIINVVLAVFNMFPIPPLDGANAIKFLALHFRIYKIAQFYNKIEPYGTIILLIILLTPFSNYLFYPAKVLISMLF